MLTAELGVSSAEFKNSRYDILDVARQDELNEK